MSDIRRGAETDFIARVRPIAERVARSYGLEIWDAQLRRESSGLVLRIFIDRPERDGPEQARPGSPEDSIGIAECERVSREISAILDVEDMIDRPYTLEVSSPGLDRPLRQPGDYRRFAGQLAKIVVNRPIDGQTHFAGRLRGLEQDEVVVVVEGKKVHRIPLGAIARARLEVDF